MLLEISNKAEIEKGGARRLSVKGCCPLLEARPSRLAVVWGTAPFFSGLFHNPTLRKHLPPLQKPGQRFNPFVALHCHRVAKAGTAPTEAAKTSDSFRGSAVWRKVGVDL